MGQIILPKGYHPDFSKPGVKPVGPIEIDPESPLSMGLSCAYPVNEVGGGIIRDYVRGNDLTANLSGSFRRPDQFGLGVETTATAGDYFSAPFVKPAFDSPFTVIFNVRPATVSGAKGVFSIANSATDGGPWMLCQRSSTALRTFVNGGYTGNFTIAADELVQVAVRYDGATWTIFYQGQNTFTRSGFGGSGAGNLFLGSGFGGSDQGHYSGVYVWENRALNDEQVRSFYEDPFQVFKPLVPQTYFIPAGAAPTVDNLLADDLSVAVELSTPAVGQAHALLADNLSVAVELSSPALTESGSDALLADDLSISVQVSSPAIGQAHALLADDLSVSVQVSSPALVEVVEGVDNLLADNLIVSVNLSSPAIGQTHALLADDLVVAVQVSSPLVDRPESPISTFGVSSIISGTGQGVLSGIDGSIGLVSIIQERGQGVSGIIDATGQGTGGAI